MRTIRNAVMAFVAAGLVGPLMQAVTWPPRVTDVTFLSYLVYEVIFYLWPARWLASGHAVDRFFTLSVLYPILANVLLFAAIGLVAGVVGARTRRFIWIVCSVVCVLLVRYGLWLAADDLEHLELLPLAVALAFCVALFWWVARMAAVDLRSAR
jgi:hypothetical protein